MRQEASGIKAPLPPGPKDVEPMEPVPAGGRRVRGMKTLFSDYASQVGARLGSAFLSLAAVMLTTRFLTPAGYSALAFYFVVSTLIFTITSAWTSTAVSRYAREQLEERGSMIDVTWGRAAITAPLALLAVVVVPGLKLAGLLPPELTWAFTWLAVAYGLIWIVADHAIYLLEAAGRMKVSAVCLLAQQALYVMVVAAIYVTGQWETAIAVGAASLGAMTTVAVFGSGLMWRVGIWPPSLDRALLRRILALSIPLIAFTVSQYVVRSVDLIVIRAFRTASIAGLYAIAYQGYNVLAAIATAAPPILTPFFVSLRATKQEALVERYLSRIVPQLSFVGAVLCGAAAPLAMVLLPVVFGKSFAAADRPMAILLGAVLFVFICHLIAPILVLHERGGAIAGYNGLAAVINVVGDVLTVGPLHMGLIGPAISTGVAMLVLAAGFFYKAGECVGTTATFNPALLLPFGAGLAPALMLSGPARFPVALGATLICAILVIRLARPFRPEDVDLVAGLDMPSSMKRVALRGVALASR